MIYTVPVCVGSAIWGYAKAGVHAANEAEKNLVGAALGRLGEAMSGEASATMPSQGDANGEDCSPLEKDASPAYRRLATA